MTIDDVIVRMGWAAAPDLTVTPLGGGITNLNYRIEIGGEAYVVRIPGENTRHLGIDRRREHAAAVAAHASGVAPQVVAFLEDSEVLVTRLIRGRALGEGEMQRPEMLRRAAAALRRYHGGAPFPGTFSPFRTVREYLTVAQSGGAPPPARFDWMLAEAGRLEAALGEPATPRPCHNDLLPANFLDDGTRLWIVDWEYAAMGDLFFDLGNLAAHHELSQAEEGTLLGAYFGRVTAGEAARLRLMRIVSDLREAMWAMVQVAVSTLDYDFAAYGRKHFQRYAAHLEDPRFPTWLAQAADPAAAGRHA
jgi:thiamine kinase-like enzyme